MSYVCPACEVPADQWTVEGCSGDEALNINGELQARIRYGDEWFFESDPPRPNEVCHDCHAGIGKLHHPGCDMERCPGCGHQALCCVCEGEFDYVDIASQIPGETKAEKLEWLDNLRAYLAENMEED